MFFSLWLIPRNSINAHREPEIRSQRPRFTSNGNAVAILHTQKTATQHKHIILVQWMDVPYHTSCMYCIRLLTTFSAIFSLRFVLLSSLCCCCCCKCVCNTFPLNGRASSVYLSNTKQNRLPKWQSQKKLPYKIVAHI